MKRWMNAALCSLLVSTAAHADVLTGTRTITLGNAEGERIVIGQVTFTPEADGKSRFRSCWMKSSASTFWPCGRSAA
jgi:hypothetical protein